MKPRQARERLPSSLRREPIMTTPTASTISLADLILLAGRLLLALIFIHEGSVLALHFDATVKTMGALGIGLALVLAIIALQLGAGLSVGLGLLTRLGATALGLFCLATAMLFHTNFASQNELLHFEKDLAIAGGMFILAVVGAGALSLDERLGRACKARSSPSCQ
jgi:putative oxidoreductase